MTYDSWKTESPEDEYERLNAPLKRQAARDKWLEDNADRINEEREERRALSDYDRQDVDDGH